MSRILAGTGLLCLLARLVFAQALALPAIDYIEGEVIVIFKSSIDLPSARQALNSHGLRMDKHFEWLSQKRGQHLGLIRARGRTTASLLNQLRNDPAVEHAEPNYLRWALGDQNFNDPLFGQLWGLQNNGQTVNGVSGLAGDDIRFRSAWPFAMPSTNLPVVAVVDSGVNYTHPDLASNVWVNAGDAVGNGLDDDGNGFVDDRHGYNFFADTGDPSDSGDHGTHVSGTIAASGNNGLGVVGVNWRAKIMALCVSGDGEYFSDAAVIEAVQYASMMKSRGVNVVAINASYGGSSYSTAERASIEAAGSVGIVFCAAAGNDGVSNDDTPTYPASYRLSNMIVVGATDQRDALAGFSNYGATTVDLCAPGVNILSTVSAAMTSRVEVASQSYAAEHFEFAATTSGLTGTLHDCGFGFPSNFTAQVAGNIAFISRGGGLYFSEKVSNAMDAGASGVIIYNNTTTPFSGTLQYANDWIPAVHISQADGLALLPTLPKTGTIFSARTQHNVYSYMSGTSMAAPHVAGAVAFAAMSFPNETVSQRIQRILAAVDPLSSLSGKVRTGGRLNLLRIVEANSNLLPDWWEQAFFGGTAVNPAADADGDGLSNLREYWADTDPLKQSSSLRLTSLLAENDQIRVDWTGGTQARQYLQRTATPHIPNSWTDIFTNEPPTTSVGTFLDASATNSALYYRVRVEGR